MNKILELELEYDEEQAQVMVQNSTEFDNWINEVVFDLANFRGGQKELLWERVETWQKNNTVGMTKERYLEMEEQLGREPDPDKCPPGIEDFPESL